MLKNFTRSWFRNVSRNKVHYFVGYGGMTVGVVCWILVMSYTFHELSFDKYHVNSSRLYRIVYGEDDNKGLALTSHVLGSSLESNIPGIAITRFNNAGNARVNFKSGENKFYEYSFFFVDSNVFKSFSFNLKRGNPQTALLDPFTMVITTETAKKFFGEEDAIGKSILMEWGTEWYEVKVTGILNDIPDESHFSFDYLISMATAEKIFQPKSFFTDWTANFCYNYILVPAERDIPSIEKSMNLLYEKNTNQNINAENRLRLQPLESIHLYSKLDGELTRNAEVKYVYLAVCIGLMIGIICFINYVNILSAIFSKRIKEIGVRKVLGASQTQLVLQFTGESIAGCSLSFLLGMALTAFFLPFFNDFLRIQIPVQSVFSYQQIGILLVAVFAIGILGGIYPSYMSLRHAPGDVLYGKVKHFVTGSMSKKILVGCQVFIAIVLIAGSLVLQKQLAFIRDKSLGFTQESLICLPQGRSVRDISELVKNEMKETGLVSGVSFSSHIPGGNLNFKVPVFPEGGNPDGTAEPWPVSVVSVDFDFLSTYQLNMDQGRFFSIDHPRDSTESFVINKSMADELGWSDPVGRTIEMSYNVGDGTTETRRGRVIGVVEDFNFESLHKHVEPLIFICKPFWYYFITFRLNPDKDGYFNLDSLAAAWKKIAPDIPFEYIYMTNRIGRLYESDWFLVKSVTVLSCIAIAISCIGIFSLVTFLVQGKLKEFSIRKVLGATSDSIMRWMLFDLMKLIMVSTIVAIPVSHFVVNWWLGGFAYKVDAGYLIYFIAMLIVSLISLALVLSQILRASRSNPVDYLKE